VLVPRHVAALGLVAAIALASSGIAEARSSRTTARRLTARLFETPLRTVASGPAGVFGVDRSDRLFRVDVRTGEAPGRPLVLDAEEVAVGTDAVWVIQDAQRGVLRLDPSTRATTSFEVPGDALDSAFVIAATDDGAWVEVGDYEPSGSTYLLVPYTSAGGPGPPLTLPCGFTDLVATERVLWASCAEGILRIDTATGEARLVDVGGEARSLAATAAGVWLLVGKRLVQVSLVGDVTTARDAPPDARFVVGDADAVWVTSGKPRGTDRITRHDARTGERNAGPLELPGGTDATPAQAADMAAHRGTVWFSLFAFRQLGIVEPSKR
jgi:streptogramin lyase